jgi:hypothetical protein
LPLYIPSKKISLIKCITKKIDLVWYMSNYNI